MLTDKPISLTHKDWLIRRLAVRLMTSEETIKAVVHHQFHHALAAMDSNNQVEFSGFGKYVFNTRKAHKDLVTVEAAIHQYQLLEDSRNQQKLQSAVELRNYLKTKLRVQD